MSHTKGPWTASQYLDDGRWGVLQDEDGGIIVSVRSKEGQMNEANARLIAAAPDLLEACKRAVELMDRMLVNDGAGGTLDWCRRAIAKAEGQ